MSAVPKQGPFYEYSVVYTDRAYNLMSPPFQTAMKTISSTLKKVYNASSVALIPGSGTYAMEAVARQFGNGKKVLVVRNGYFSYRWSDIFEVCDIPEHATVLKARPIDGQKGEAQPSMAPCPIDEVVARIAAEKPAVVFAPQVETSTGIIIGNDYIKALADAVHAVGGILVIDAIAAGNVWLDMKATGTDVLISAPQKGWTGPACVGIVVLNETAAKLAKETKSNSFCCNLTQWLDVMEKYENEDGSGPGFRYYTTLPTDSLMTLAEICKETSEKGFPDTKKQMLELGGRIRKELADRGFKSVAADEFAAPGVVVVYSKIAGMVGKFKQVGLQIAGGVPWKLGEEEYGVDSKATTFRLGLFGLDKLTNIDEVVNRFTESIDKIIAESK